ncbi:hypothetical protein OOZ15_18195 [Galbibacter sp. EGI 63066]|uniref:hypothetical protein n=1 Tax=Galbibacter sp. EGI 63066 TaxID=2993559 RepID=UPI0022490A63|nr:hypothetical protein [Galbibacter sp. EGI 63066]MCX2681889.1 hypothetical protein [Galbibacter sp. EGI 63066]
MKTAYHYKDTIDRNYQGIVCDEQEYLDQLKGPVKDNLIDREQRDELLDSLKTLKSDTGFGTNDQLLADIQALENNEVNTQNFRVGEAYAEIVLEENFQCRFHWNELRDARNPKGNKTGADLVGFIEIDGQILFLFGEVKTSSENAHPPQVMTYQDGMENQLCDLCDHPEKRRILISYLQNKARLFEDGHQFKDDFSASIKSYYAENGRFQLVGVLVRDTDPVEEDVSESYHRIKDQILVPTGLKLLALYVPVKKLEWLKIMNGTEE